jgi:nucleoside-diphosphate-sugar epimerase
MTEFMKNLRTNQPPVVHGDGLQTSDFVNVEDVVGATVLALDYETASGVYNIATGIETTIRDLAVRLVSITGRTSTLTNAPARSGDIRRSVGDVCASRLKEDSTEGSSASRAAPYSYI